MRARTKVREVTLTVKGDFLIFGKIKKHLKFVGFILTFDKFYGLIARQCEAFDLVIGFHDFLHGLFDKFEVF